MASKDFVIKNVILSDGDPANDNKWVSQLKVKKEKYDIATHHSIKFYDGDDDETGTSWNGTSELEVVIPDIEPITDDDIDEMFK